MFDATFWLGDTHASVCVPYNYFIWSSGPIFRLVCLFPDLWNNYKMIPSSRRGKIPLVEEILENLPEKFQVKVAYRFPPRSKPPYTPNFPHYLCYSYPPTNVKIGYCRCSLLMFILQSNWCLKYQKINHSEKYFLGTIDFCARCCKEDHTPCSNSFWLNYKGNLSQVSHLLVWAEVFITVCSAEVEQTGCKTDDSNAGTTRPL